MRDWTEAEPGSDQNRNEVERTKTCADPRRYTGATECGSSAGYTGQSRNIPEQVPQFRVVDVTPGEGLPSLRVRLQEVINAYESLQPRALAAYQLRHILDRNSDLAAAVDIIQEFGF